MSWEYGQFWLFIFALGILPLPACVQTGPSDTGAMQAERDLMQAAMDVMMGDQQLTSVAASAKSTNLWANYPTGAGTVPLSPCLARPFPAI